MSYKYTSRVNGLWQCRRCRTCRVQGCDRSDTGFRRGAPTTAATHSHSRLSRLDICCARESPRSAATTEVAHLVARGDFSRCPK
jgi:hypothetical protein